MAAKPSTQTAKPDLARSQQLPGENVGVFSGRNGLLHFHVLRAPSPFSAEFFRLPPKTLGQATAIGEQFELGSIAPNGWSKVFVSFLLPAQKFTNIWGGIFRGLEKSLKLRLIQTISRCTEDRQKTLNSNRIGSLQRRKCVSKERQDSDELLLGFVHLDHFLARRENLEFLNRWPDVHI